MRWPFIIMLMTAIFCGGCSDGFTIADDEMIEYKLKPGQYAVVVIIDAQTSLDQARKAARHRAAEITVRGGYRYFWVQSESQTQVIRQKADNHDIFIEGEFQPLAKAESNETAFPALRVVFQCFEQKPKSKAFKACNFTDCSKIKPDEKP
jgi:hypothetical protein